VDRELRQRILTEFIVGPSMIKKKNAFSRKNPSHQEVRFRYSIYTIYMYVYMNTLKLLHSHIVCIYLNIVCIYLNSFRLSSSLFDFRKI